MDQGKVNHISAEEQNDRSVKMLVERIKKIITEDVRTRNLFDVKMDGASEAEKIIQCACELAGKEPGANHTEGINKTDFPDDFLLIHFAQQSGMNASSIEVFEEITQEKYYEENSFGIRFNYKFREPASYYKFTIPIPEGEVQHA